MTGGCHIPTTMNLIEDSKAQTDMPGTKHAKTIDDMNMENQQLQHEVAQLKSELLKTNDLIANMRNDLFQAKLQHIDMHY